jgi:hypothetical protein
MRGLGLRILWTALVPKICNSSIPNALDQLAGALLSSTELRCAETRNGKACFGHFCASAHLFNCTLAQTASI